MPDASTDQTTQEDGAVGELIVEINSLLLSTRSKADTALRLSTGNPRQLRDVARLDDMLTAPLRYSRQLASESTPT